MITYKNLYAPAIELGNIKNCITAAAKNGKMKKACVRKVVENIDKEAEIVRDMMLRHDTGFETYELHTIREGI